MTKCDVYFFSSEKMIVYRSVRKGFGILYFYIHYTAYLTQHWIIPPYCSCTLRFT